MRGVEVNIPIYCIITGRRWSDYLMIMGIKYIVSINTDEGETHGPLNCKIPTYLLRYNAMSEFRKGD